MFGKKKQIVYRQGDVLIERIEDDEQESEMPEFSRVPLDKGRVVLAYGEVTGHAHAIDVKDRRVDGSFAGYTDNAVLFDNGRGVRILAVKSESDLVHEEHDTITLAPGRYRVSRQREWDDNQERMVAD